MEYGGITPLGLPDEWRVLVDPRCLDIDVAIIGSGVRRSKIAAPRPAARRAPRRRGRGWTRRLRGTGHRETTRRTTRAGRDPAAARGPQVGRPAPGATGHADRRPADRRVPAHPAVPAEVRRPRRVPARLLPRAGRAGRGDHCAGADPGRRAPHAVRPAGEGAAGQDGRQAREPRPGRRRPARRRHHHVRLRRGRRPHLGGGRRRRHGPGPGRAAGPAAPAPDHQGSRRAAPVNRSKSHPRLRNVAGCGSSLSTIPAPRTTGPRGASCGGWPRASGARC